MNAYWHSYRLFHYTKHCTGSYSHFARNARFRDAHRHEAADFSTLVIRDGLTTFIFAFGSGLGDPFALSFEHHFPLELRNRPHDIQHKLARCRASIKAKVQNSERDPFCRQTIHDFAKVANVTGKAIQLGDDDSIALTGKFERFVQFGTF